MSSFINWLRVKEELTVFLRNQDILSIITRGVTTATDNFSGDASTLTFTLSQKPVKNVRTVLVSAVSKINYIDYTIDYKDADPSAFPTITFTSAPGVGVANINVTYDYGPDKIFPDFPRVDLTLDSYPRISVTLTSGKTIPAGLGGMSHFSDVIMSIYVWVPVKKDSVSGIGGENSLLTILASVRQAIETNAKTFFYFKYIHPVGTSPIIVPSERTNYVLQQSEDYELFKIFEIV